MKKSQNNRVSWALCPDMDVDIVQLRKQGLPGTFSGIGHRDLEVERLLSGSDIQGGCGASHERSQEELSGKRNFTHAGLRQEYTIYAWSRMQGILCAQSCWPCVAAESHRGFSQCRNSEDKGHTAYNEKNLVKLDNFYWFLHDKITFWIK